MKKYELLEDDKIIVDGYTLYRVKAVRSFGYVEAGDLGGYIEGERNLSHEGDCWVGGKACVYEAANVYGNARVFGNATVYGNADIYGRAMVYGEVEVSGYAQIFGDAQILGDVEIGGRARVSGNARVRDDARVSGNARVFGGAYVGGNAQVFGDATVFGEAEVAGYAKLSTPSDFIVFTNVGSENGTLTIYKGVDRYLLATLGCFTGTVEELLDESKQVHDEKALCEYQLLIAAAKARILGE